MFNINAMFNKKYMRTCGTIFNKPNTGDVDLI